MPYKIYMYIYIYVIGIPIDNIGIPILYIYSKPTFVCILYFTYEIHSFYLYL